jgi:hypothetical protein
VRRSAIAGWVIAAIGCGGVAWGIFATQAGCTLQGQCDATTAYVPRSALPPGAAGQFVTGQSFAAGAGVYSTSAGVVWQTSPIQGQWMSFQGQLTYYIFPQLPDGGPFVGPYTYPEIEISADPNPEANPSSNFAPGAGNPVEVLALPDGGTTGFTVFNNTCSTYYLWMQVAQEYTPDAAASPPPPDAGTD